MNVRAWILAFFMSVMSIGMAHAETVADDDGSTALQELVSNFTADGNFTQALKNSAYFGDISIRVPRSKIQFINFTPPSFSAGCGGISFHFGGFSFIDGEQISQLIENIMAGATGLVIQMGIQAFCPICADVLAKLQKLAQMASKMGADSCALAKSLVSNTVGKLPGLSDSTKKDVGKRACANYNSLSNKNEDFVSGWETYCAASNAFEKGIEAIDDFIKGAGGTDEDAKAQAADVLNAGNKVYATLIQMGYTKKQAAFLMSVIGVPAYTPINIKNPKSDVKQSVPGWANVEPLIDIMWFGYKGSSACATKLNKIASSFGGGSSKENSSLKEIKKKMDEIADKAGDLTYTRCFLDSGKSGGSTWYSTGNSKTRYQECEFVESRHLSEADPAELPIPQCGMFVDTYSQLHALVKAAASGQPLPVEGMALIRNVNLPIYKIVKIARTYPTAAENIAMEYAPLITHLLVKRLLDKFLSPAGSPIISGKIINDIPDVRKHMQSVALDLQNKVAVRADTMTTLFDYQFKMAQNIAKIEQYMYKEAIGGNLMQSDVYSQLISRQGLKK